MNINKFLGFYCFECGGLLGKASLAIGRCKSCASMVASATSEELRQEFELVPIVIKQKITQSIKKNASKLESKLGA